jgi:uncharacterized protein YggE
MAPSVVLSCGRSRGRKLPQQGGHDPATVSVVGTGTATGTPDTALLSVGVDVTKPTATDASSDAATAAQAMLAAIKGQGIADADITTTGLSMNPVTTWDQSTGTHVTGYESGESFSVKIRDITHTAAVM